MMSSIFRSSPNKKRKFQIIQNNFKSLIPGLIVILFFINASLVLAHDIIVKRNSNLRENPTAASDVLQHLESGDELILLEPEKQNGYYHAIYKNYTGWVWSHNVTVIQEYERSQWKHWIDADRDGQNTRTEVLIAESELPIAFDDSDSSKVLSGRWTDPYTGEVFTDPNKLDVDHMVPLGNAHRTDGWIWNFEMRMDYANDLENPEHLIAVKSSENRSKGAKGPDKWMPPNKAYHCEYVNNWVEIKTRWNLTITEAESTKIAEVRAHCSPN
ncbi:DUF1524 domain-containing protein [candidate division KSB1 bacterium]|nr:DUF1524 domain-containing protein [candidate division KSB1 bacterium]